MSKKELNKNVLMFKISIITFIMVMCYIILDVIYEYKISKVLEIVIVFIGFISLYQIVFSIDGVD